MQHLFEDDIILTKVLLFCYANAKDSPPYIHVSLEMIHHPSL